MTEYDAIKAIHQRWMQQWPGLSTNQPYVFDSDVFDEPVNAYARLSVTLTGDEQHTLGAAPNRKFLRTGQIDVKLFGSANLGRGPLDQTAALVRTIFEGARFGATGTEDGVVCYASSSKELKSQTDAQWWLLLVSTPFEFFEVR